MEDHRLNDVIVSYSDPFNVWEEIKPNMHHILPLPVNVKKINGSNWNRHDIRFPGLDKELGENGTFYCRYVKADDTHPNDFRNANIHLHDDPFLHLYILPPMDVEFFKRNVKAQLKSFISPLKTKCLIIYGICNKENGDQQKANCKTIYKIRHMFQSLSLRQNRLCLVPMLELPMLNVQRTSMAEEDPERNEETFGTKNWENVGMMMSECISETVAARLSDIAAVIYKTNAHITCDRILLYESVLRIYGKCGFTLDAVDGYVELMRIVEADLKKTTTPKDFLCAPFVFYMETGYSVGNEASQFDIYQYLCCTAIRLLEPIKGVASLSRVCRIFVDCCMLMFMAVRRDLRTKHLLWLLALINRSLSYLQDSVISTSDQLGIIEKVTISSNNEPTFSKTSKLAKLRSAIKRKKGRKLQNDEPVEHSGHFTANLIAPDTNDAQKKHYQPSNSRVGVECAYNINNSKCVRRCIGLLYTFLYKTLKTLDSTPLIDDIPEIAHAPNDESPYKLYRIMVSEMWETVKLPDGRHRMMADAMENGALNFSHGDLPRFSNVMASLYDRESAVCSIEKDASQLGWYLRAFDKGDRKHVFAWFGPHEPNVHLSDPLDGVKTVLQANLDCLHNHPNMCLTPTQIEDEAVNDYLRVLSDAKLAIDSTRGYMQTYGQFLKHKTDICKIRLNVYSTDDRLEVNIRVRLREDQEQMIDEHPPTLFHECEELTLSDVTLHRGVNFYVLKHRFSKACNYTLDSVIISGETFKVVQRPCTPIPLAVLSGVVRALKAHSMVSSYKLSSLVLPPSFIRSDREDTVTLTARPCSDAITCSDSVLLTGVKNYIAFYLFGFTVGRICFHKSSLRYDIERFSLYSDEIKVSCDITNTEDGIVLNLTKGRASSHLICASVTVDSKFKEDKILQVVSVYNGRRLDFNLEFTIIPPFCREVVASDNALLQVVLGPTAPFYTEVESVVINGCPMVKDPTLLERGSDFCISIDENGGTTGTSYRSTAYNSHATLPTGKVHSVRDVQMPSVLQHTTAGPEERDFSSDNQRGTQHDTSSNGGCIAPISRGHKVIVSYRILRHKCIHHRTNVGCELEALSNVLEYHFSLPQLSGSDVTVEYNTPPFCFIGMLFEACVTIRSAKEVSFEYELESNDNWFVEGPVRGKNQVLRPIDSLQLRFKMMAVEGAGCGIIRLPSIRFWRLRAPLVHKEIFLLNNNNTKKDLLQGTDLGIDELMRYYHVCLLSCGAESPRPFPIPGDNCEGVFDSLDIIRSYNSHPDAPGCVQSYFRRLAKLGRRVTVGVIGNGNVALDVARILLTPVSFLENTEIDKTFLHNLRSVDIGAVAIIGRRGIFQSSFTNPELRKIAQTNFFSPVTCHDSVERSLVYQPPVLDRRMRRRLEFFNGIARDTIESVSSPRILQFKFFNTVNSIEGGNDSAINALVLDDNTLDDCLNAQITGKQTRLKSDMLIKCVGFQRSEDSDVLLRSVDLKRIFGCGWFATNGQGDLSATLAATVQLSRIVASLNFDFPVEDDILDLFIRDSRFSHVRHGPQVEFISDAKSGHSIHIEVSNAHNLLFVAQSKTVCIYRLTDFVSSVVANEPYDAHLLDRITFEDAIKRIRILCELHLIACQLPHKVVVYDFSMGHKRFESEFAVGPECVYWSGQRLLVRDSDAVLHMISMDGNKKTILKDCKSISPAGSDGFHVICRCNDTLSLQVFKDFPDPLNFITLQLPSFFEASQITDVVGSYVISGELVAIGLVIDIQDSLILLCHYTSSEATVVHWAFNELFLNVDDICPQIEFVWVNEWQCLFAWSNAATMVVVLSRHVKLVGDGKWHVVNMKEGYCLESVDIDCCPTDLVVCTSYRDKLYRKNASADAPLLTDPTVFVLAQGGSKIALHYADTWLIDKDLKEVEQLPRLSRDTDGSLFSSFVSSRSDGKNLANTKSTIHHTSEIPEDEHLDDMFACTKVEHTDSSCGQNSRTGITALAHPQDTNNFRKSDGLYKNPADGGLCRFTDSSISPNVASSQIGHGRQTQVCGPLSAVDELYHSSVKAYAQMPDENETNLERIRLLEMLCNCFHVFESRLGDLESTTCSEVATPLSVQMDDWASSLEDVNDIYNEIVRNVSGATHNYIHSSTAVVPDEIKSMYEETMQSYASKFRIHGAEVDLKDMEHHLNATKEVLISINDKLDAYENEISVAENNRLINHKAETETCRDSGVRQPTSESKMTDINDLIKNLKDVKIKHAPNPDMEYKEVKMKFNEYDALSKLKSNENICATSTLFTDKEHVRGCDLLYSKNDLETERFGLHPFSATNKTVGAPMETTTSDFRKEGNCYHSDRTTSSAAGAHSNDGIYTDAMQPTVQSSKMIANGNIECMSVGGDNTVADVSSLDASPSSIPDTTRVGIGTTVPTISSMPGDAILQLQTYTFGDSGDLATGTLSGACFAPAAAPSGPAPFAHFATNSPLSFADLALSKSAGKSMTNDIQKEPNQSFGERPLTGAMPSFTGIMGFTSGNFQANDTQNASPIFDYSSNALGSGFTSDDKAPIAKSGGDIWSSFRRSNPLD
ncbi:Ferredoxin-NADP(+) reductase [Babesia ovata]|uniref:Ferredoxin-NADP(+) reductase n=1 Tax=Babesia ovata TaxID=189622 RepID=A0A2H6KI85_9APIC|nr:Ferredoxin-NADP(+) reductase [Babesia ovata]GBE62689.1 Ferredoxin-NADP(+) reductase [Babesia ovata]